MNGEECFREPDVVQAVTAGEWPGRAEAGLREHVSSCAVCAEVLAVALAFQVDAGDAAREVHVPTAAHVWWRAGIRARQDAAQTAARPITIAEGVAAASGVGLAAGAIALGWTAAFSGFTAAGPLPIALALGGVVAALLLVPVAIYFVVTEPKI